MQGHFLPGKVQSFYCPVPKAKVTRSWGLSMGLAVFRAAGCSGKPMFGSRFPGNHRLCLTRRSSAQAGRRGDHNPQNGSHPPVFGKLGTSPHLRKHGTRTGCASQEDVGPSRAKLFCPASPPQPTGLHGDSPPRPLPVAAACAVPGSAFVSAPSFPGPGSCPPMSSFTVYTNNSIYKVERCGREGRKEYS